MQIYTKNDNLKKIKFTQKMKITKKNENLQKKIKIYKKNEN